MDEDERKQAEATISEGLDDMIKTLRTVSRISPAWRKRVSRKVAEALKYAEGESEGDSESDADAARRLRTEDAQAKLTKAFNSEMVPHLRKRFGVVHE